MQKNQSINTKASKFLIISIILMFIIVSGILAITLSNLKPITNLNYTTPRNIVFNFTLNYANEVLKNCSLWGNFTGTWNINRTQNIKFQLTNFNISSNSTFSGNQNITKYLKLYRNMTVINATIDLIAYTNCSPEISISENGITIQTSGFDNVSKITDNNWSTFATITSGSLINLNYTKLLNVNATTIWSIKIGNSSEQQIINITFNTNTSAITNAPRCWADLKNLRVTAGSGGVIPPNKIRIGCRNGTTLYSKDYAGYDRVYDEKIYWKFNQCVTNVSIDSGNSGMLDYSMTGTFNTTQNNILLNKTELNNWLNTNCGTNCNLPVKFHSSTSGLLQYSDINVNYQYKNNSILNFTNYINVGKYKWNIQCYNNSNSLFWSSANNTLSMDTVRFTHNFVNFTRYHNLNLSYNINCTGSQYWVKDNISNVNDIQESAYQNGLTGSCTDKTKAYDSDWSTYPNTGCGALGFTNRVYENYTLPQELISVKYKAGYYGFSALANVTCWNYTSLGWTKDLSKLNWTGDEVGYKNKTITIPTVCYSSSPIKMNAVHKYAATGEYAYYVEGRMEWNRSVLVTINSSNGLISDNPVLSEYGSYKVNVTCGDGLTNVSRWFLYRINDTKPTIPTLSYPQNIWVSSLPTVNWSSTDSESDAIIYYLYLGNTTSPTTVYQRSVNSYTTSGLADDRYFYKLIAGDTELNSSFSSLGNFTLDRGSPTRTSALSISPTNQLAQEEVFLSIRLNDTMGVNRVYFQVQKASGSIFNYTASVNTALANSQHSDTGLYTNASWRVTFTQTGLAGTYTVQKIYVFDYVNHSLVYTPAANNTFVIVSGAGGLPNPPILGGGGGGGGGGGTVGEKRGEIQIKITEGFKLQPDMVDRYCVYTPFSKSKTCNVIVRTNRALKECISNNPSSDCIISNEDYNITEGNYTNKLILRFELYKDTEVSELYDIEYKLISEYDEIAYLKSRITTLNLEFNIPMLDLKVDLDKDSFMHKLLDIFFKLEERGD